MYTDYCHDAEVVLDVLVQRIQAVIIVGNVADNLEKNDILLWFAPLTNMELSAT